MIWQRKKEHYSCNESSRVVEHGQNGFWTVVSEVSFFVGNQPCSLLSLTIIILHEFLYAICIVL